MTLILQLGIIGLMVSLVVILIKWGNQRMYGAQPTSLATFMAILFTSGLDMGLVILPLTEFPKYQTDESFLGIHPVALEFGFWGFLVWSFYFVTCFYFCCLEPKLQFFERKWVRYIHNFIIIGTCAFTAYLFLANMAWYLPSFGKVTNLSIVAVILLVGVYSSTDIRYVKYLSVGSTWLFFALIGVVALQLDDPLEPIGVAANISEYFLNLPTFVLPMNDYHAFYLFWWFAWCLMIGQFVAKFLGGLKTYQVLLSLLILPSIPLALWFSVLFTAYESKLTIQPWLNGLMLVVGIVFVINSVDSLVRLYSDNLKLTVAKLGFKKYLSLHFTLLFSLVLAFIFTPLNIEWVGSLVILLMFAAAVSMVSGRRSMGS